MDNISFETFSLEALACDDSQAEQFADCLEKRGLHTAPANLKSSILERSRQVDIKFAAGANHLSKKAELLCYGLKVGLAAACSIAVIAVMPDFHSRHTPIYVEAYEKIQEWNGKINEFSKSLFYWEVPFHDK